MGAANEEWFKGRKGHIGGNALADRVRRARAPGQFRHRRRRKSDLLRITRLVMQPLLGVFSLGMKRQLESLPVSASVCEQTDDVAYVLSWYVTAEAAASIALRYGDKSCTWVDATAYMRRHLKLNQIVHAHIQA
ncbi:hypothetical protein Cni_G00954 [Canna indica]|uniref:Uncharacterized protein n=1 Tax=Canna indica TaxID=4628 RepID=A0AAQ3JND1_9LILI|nr:hypothetical protein Cni_G00954 [Canna indica]